MQRVVVVTPPDPIMELAEVKDHLRVDHGDDDLLIEAYLAAVTGHIDGPAGWLGRCIGIQTLEAGLDGFVHDPIALPYPPVIEVESIQYEDVLGNLQTLDPATYETRYGEVGTAWGKSWPGTRAYRGSSRAVRIRYVAGYEEVPPAIRVAVLMMAADLYKFRESVGASSAAAEIRIPTAVEMLLQPFRVYA
jgi:uncharacterized phiE125 gp8 family phage protein